MEMQNIIHEVRISTAALIMVLEGLKLLKNESRANKKFNNEDIKKLMISIEKVIEDDEKRNLKEIENA